MLLALLGCTANSPEDTGPTTLDERVVLGAESVCPAPAATTSYTDAGEAWGLLDPLIEAGRHEESPSIAAGDLDADGRDDVAVLQSLGFGYVYLNAGLRFAEDSPRGLEPGPAVLFHDVDGDGALDTVVAGATPYYIPTGEDRPIPLVTLPSTAAASTVTAHDISVGDLDNDGVADLYLPMTYDEWHPDTQFNDAIVSLAAGAITLNDTLVPLEVGYRHGFDATWYDDDADGDLDVYLVNDLGSVFGASTLLRNDGGTFVDAADTCFCSILKSNKGVDVADFDHDGRPDLYVTGSPRNTLFAQLEDGSRVDVTTVTDAGGVDDPTTGWGGGFVDFDNDGWLDLISAPGDRWNEGNDNPRVDVAPKLLRQQDGVFTDVAAEVGMVAMGSFRAVVTTDFNTDGVEDILMTQLDGAPYLFLSDSCTEAAWVEVEAPLGSRIEVKAGGVTHTDWSRIDQGYQSNGPRRVHIGLGAATTVDTLSVTLPSGEVIVTPPFAARRRVTVALP